MFISKKAFHTFSGYAFAQIKKAKGENKWINRPAPKEPPQKEDFCWVIGRGGMVEAKCPCRPMPYSEALADNGYPLEMCHVAALEHVQDTYRLYYYGKEAKGVFRDGNLVCESIPLDDEEGRFVGLLIFNDREYQKAMLDWKNYWTWVRERNPNRWLDQEAGLMAFDGKNMQHCLRLLMSGKAILERGEPIVRFVGDDLEFLKAVRNGKFTYEEIMARVEAMMSDLEACEKSSALPWGPDMDRIDALFREIVGV